MVDAEPHWSEVLMNWLQRAGQWVADHAEEIEAFSRWSGVALACREARLYAPVEPTAWLAISDAWQQREISRERQVAPAERERIADELRASMKAVILDSYRPGTPGFDALTAELLAASLLGPRQREVQEVLDSLADGRSFVTMCGAFPLVEYVLARASGKWRSPAKYEFDARLEDDWKDLSEDEQTALTTEYAAVMMVRSIPDRWTGSVALDTVTPSASRNAVLHGTAIGWDTPDNALEAVLLLAAACKVATPLIGPRPIT